MAKKRPPRALLPLPLEPIRDVPGMATFPGSVYNAVITLAVLYWLGGCRPLPLESSELAALVRYAAPRWQRAQPRVIAALEHLLPILAARHHSAADGYARRIIAAYKGGHASVAKRLNRSAPPLRPSIADTRSATAPTTPSKAKPYQGDGRTDLQTRQAIRNAQHSQTAAGLSDARLRDAPSAK